MNTAPNRIGDIAATFRHLRAALDSLYPCRHGPDFCSVSWFGTLYTFTPAQARIVEVLWKAWENGTPDVRQETLLEAADVSASRLQHLFRTKDKKHHPAWGVMIVPNPEGVKGLYRLNGGDTP